MVYQSEGMWKSEEDSQVEPRSAFVKRGFCIQNYYSLTYQIKSREWPRLIARP